MNSRRFTRSDAVQGGYVREGYLLCQKHVNEKGGALGRPIEFVIRDDGSDPKAAAALYEKLITEDKVDPGRRRPVTLVSSSVLAVASVDAPALPAKAAYGMRWTLNVEAKE
jgi:hypothetical protein